MLKSTWIKVINVSFIMCISKYYICRILNIFLLSMIIQEVNRIWCNRSLYIGFTEGFFKLFVMNIIMNIIRKTIKIPICCIINPLDHTLYRGYNNPVLLSS